MSKLYFSVITVLFTYLAFAQPKKGEFINASIGLGLVAPYDESEITGSGFYAQAEYVWAPKTWFGVRPYAGFVVASDETNEAGVREYIKSNAFLMGAKVRIAAPIPYVAPFIEVGAGMSIGSFETNTIYTEVKKSGALFHIPFSLGLALGKNHGTEFKFTYYYHSSVDQFSGAAALGLTFPLDKQ